jgi:hypothetical protein
MDRRSILRMLLGVPLFPWVASRVARVRTHLRNGWILRADDL